MVVLPQLLHVAVSGQGPAQPAPPSASGYKHRCRKSIEGRVAEVCGSVISGGPLCRCYPSCGMLVPVLGLSARLVEVGSRGFPGALAAGICAALIAGCGSSSTRSGASASGGPLLKYAQCVRAHGVPNFPDPKASGGLVIPNDINTDSPAFKAAEQACASLAGPTVGRPGSSESRKLQLVAIARCMRSHGVPSFSDPTSSPPPPGSGNVIGADGWYLALGTSRERESPVYRRAATACGAGIR